MSKKIIVVALGHEALGETLPKQKEALKRAVKSIADLVEADYKVAVTHSNGPQVSMIHTAMTELSKKHPEYTVSPMSVCSAMSQGYIGYDLQNTLRSELLERGIYKSVCTILTQVSVDAYDEAFGKPDKEIGRFMTEEEAKEEEEKSNYVVHKEGRGYRRIVASPRPIEIMELDAIKTLIGSDQVVIACGGGGIPVLEQGSKLKGASAVIEKDLASAALAKQLDANELLILTGVDNVYLSFGKETQTPIKTMSVKEAENYVRAKEFEKNTMLPKIEAACEFCKNAPGRKAYITSLHNAKKAVKGKVGTCITA